MNKKNFVPKLYPLNHDTRKVWFVQWQDNRGVKRKTYGNLNKLPTKKARLKEAENIIFKLSQSELVAPVKSYNLYQLLSKLVHSKIDVLEHKSYLSYDSIVNGFGYWYKTIKKNDNPITDYFNYLAAKGLHKNTIRGKCCVLKSLTAELIRNKTIKENPFEGVLFKRVKATSKLPFNTIQTQLLKDYMSIYNTQLLLACEFMYYLYLRPNELRQLKIKDILFDDWKVVLSGTIAKDDDTIYKKIPLPFRDKINTLRNCNMDHFIFSHNNKPGAKMLSVNNLSNQHKIMLKKLNISNRYSFYSWVHTGIKNAALSNIPIKELQLQKGHHDLNMFNQYLKDLGVDDCVALVNNFPAM
ncbi:MAG: site-specific integrase [Bacteroidetes bacterium]|nr:site-specific integrase [Bacteroidota bacterium]